MASSLSWLLVFALSLFTLANAADVRALLNERAACVSTSTVTSYRTSVVLQTVKTTTTYEATSKTKTVTTTVSATSTPTFTVSMRRRNQFLLTLYKTIFLKTTHSFINSSVTQTTKTIAKTTVTVAGFQGVTATIYTTATDAVTNQYTKTSTNVQVDSTTITNTQTDSSTVTNTQTNTV